MFWTFPNIRIGLRTNTKEKPKLRPIIVKFTSRRVKSRVMENRKDLTIHTGENLDAVTAVTDSFKMADTFAGDRTGGAVAQTSAHTICISVWQGRVWIILLQGIHGSGWRVAVRAKSAIVDPRDAAVTAPLFTFTYSLDVTIIFRCFAL